MTAIPTESVDSSLGDGDSIYLQTQDGDLIEEHTQSQSLTSSAYIHLHTHSPRSPHTLNNHCITYAET